MNIDYSRPVPTVSVVHPISGERMTINVADLTSKHILWEDRNRAEEVQAEEEVVAEPAPRRRGRPRRG